MIKKIFKGVWYLFQCLGFSMSLAFTNAIETFRNNDKDKDETDETE